MSVTSAFSRLGVLAKSDNMRGVQWVLPPPTIVILGVMVSPICWLSLEP
jgi:hypothetical protein